MSEMTAAKKMRSHLGSGAPKAIVEEACKQSVERLATLQTHLPPKAMRLLMVLLDPRWPCMHKEGLTCEEPNMARQDSLGSEGPQAQGAGAPRNGRAELGATALPHGLPRGGAASIAEAAAHGGRVFVGGHLLQAG